MARGGDHPIPMGRPVQQPFLRRSHARHRIGLRQTERAHPRRLHPQAQSQGLLDEITLNTKHLDRPLWETLETLMHEYVHLWQQNFGEHPVERNYHNVEFAQRCEAIGLHPLVGSGVHLKPADGVFAEFLKAYAVPEPPPLKGTKLSPKGKPLDWWVNPRERRKGRSTLAKWTCGCQNVRVGTREFHAQCLRCGSVFERVDPEEDRKTAADDTKPTVESGWMQGILDLSACHDDDAPADDHGESEQMQNPGPHSGTHAYSPTA